MGTGRIRTIKPELIACERFANLPDAPARLFLGLYSIVDDAGRSPASPGYIDGQIFPGRRRGNVIVGRLLGQLEAARLVDLYRVDGDSYLAVLGWSEKSAPTHQVINRASGPRFPAPVSLRSWNDLSEASFPEQRPASSDSDRDPDRGLLSAAATALAPSPDGWKPPAGGEAEKIARKRIAAGEITEADAIACWLALAADERQLTLKPNADAIAARWIAKQRPASSRAGKGRIEPSRDEDYTEDLPSWATR